MAVVDAHAHIYPEKIAEKASVAVGKFYLLAMFGDGMSHTILKASKAAEPPITHHIVHSVATSTKQVASINDFIVKQCAEYPGFIGFAAMHQDFENPEAELQRAREMGLRGVKIHPDIQRVNMDDERLMRVYEICERLGLPVIIHTGDYRYDYSHPRRLVNVLHEFPHLVVDAAHFGGWSIFDLAIEYLEFENCFLDCSSSLALLGTRRSRELIELYGTDRIMFGSDFPMWDPADEMKRFRALGFSDAEYEKMCWHNAERFLGCDIID